MVGDVGEEGLRLQPWEAEGPGVGLGRGHRRMFWDFKGRGQRWCFSLMGSGRRVWCCVSSGIRHFLKSKTNTACLPRMRQNWATFIIFSLPVD